MKKQGFLVADFDCSHIAIFSDEKRIKMILSYEIVEDDKIKFAIIRSEKSSIKDSNVFISLNSIDTLGANSKTIYTPIELSTDPLKVYCFSLDSEDILFAFRFDENLESALRLFASDTIALLESLETADLFYEGRC